MKFINLWNISLDNFIPYKAFSKNYSRWKVLLLREIAEAAGLEVPASKYKEKMENHFMYGSNERTAEHMKDFGDKA